MIPKRFRPDNVGRPAVKFGVNAACRSLIDPETEYEVAMADALLITAAVSVFALLLAAGWLLTLMSLPGNWLMVAAAALYAAVVPDASRWDLSWSLVGILALMAAIGELAEGLAAAAGVRKLSGSRRAAILSILGATVGALVGTGAFPLPVVGTLLGAGIGAMLGDIAGEVWKGTTTERLQQIGWAAFWGRILGSIAKLIVACAMVAVALAGLVLR